MKLAVFSHKLVWENPDSPSGYATDGGFAFHMDAISKIFDETIIAVPVSKERFKEGEVFIAGNNIRIFPLKNINDRGLKRKVNFVFWFTKNVFAFNKLINSVDAVHTPIPSDIGTMGMLMTKIKNKPLFVRYCGNWLVQKTKAEFFWKWFMERFAGGKNVMLATGLENEPPSKKNSNMKWIFSSSITNNEIEQLSRNLPKFDPNNPRLIIVCRMDFGKGAGKVIEALAVLHKEYPSIHLDLVGDGPALNYFKELATKLNVEKNITFHGKLNHIQVLETLQKSHIFCFPTASEGFPKVVLEALASGLPVVATGVSAISQLLSSGSGILLENDSPEKLTEALKILLNNPASYPIMQQKAIKTANRFSLEAWSDLIKTNLIEAKWKLK